MSNFKMFDRVKCEINYEVKCVVNCGGVVCIDCYLDNDLSKRRGKVIDDKTRDIFGNIRKNPDIHKEFVGVKLVFSNLHDNDEEITVNPETIPDSYIGIKLKEVIYKTKEIDNKVIFRRVLIKSDIESLPTSYTKNVIFFPKRIGKTIIGWIGAAIEVPEEPKESKQNYLFSEFGKASNSGIDLMIYRVPPVKMNGLKIVPYYEDSVFGSSLSYKYSSIGILPYFEEYFALLLTVRSKKINYFCFKFIIEFFTTYSENPVLRDELVDRLIFN